MQSGPSGGLVLIGRPGVGKTTILNGLLPEGRLFHSGTPTNISLAESVQEAFSSRLSLTLYDTPNYSESNEYTKALLKVLGNPGMRICFVVTLKHLRAAQEDVQMIKRVCELVGMNQADERYAVIVNKYAERDGTTPGVERTAVSKILSQSFGTNNLYFLAVSPHLKFATDARDRIDIDAKAEDMLRNIPVAKNDARYECNVPLVGKRVGYDVRCAGKPEALKLYRPLDLELYNMLYRFEKHCLDRELNSVQNDSHAEEPHRPTTSCAHMSFLYDADMGDSKTIRQLREVSKGYKNDTGRTLKPFPSSSSPNGTHVEFHPLRKGYENDLLKVLLKVLQQPGRHIFAFVLTENDLRTASWVYMLAVNFQFLLTSCLRLFFRCSIVLCKSPPKVDTSGSKKGETISQAAPCGLSASVVKFQDSQSTEKLLQLLLKSSFQCVIPAFEASYPSGWILENLSTALSRLVQKQRSAYGPERTEIRICAAEEYDQLRKAVHDAFRLSMKEARPFASISQGLNSDVQHGKALSIGTLVGDIMNSIGIPICDADTDLLTKLEPKPVHEHEFESQLSTLGICVGAPVLDLPKHGVTHLAQIVPAHLNRTVTIDSTRLTSAGLSVLMWLLPPSREYTATIVGFMRTTTFKNCLVEHVLSEHRFGTNENLFVPEAWLDWLGVPLSFLDDHQIACGDLGVMVGTFKGIPSWFANVRARHSAPSTQEPEIQTATTPPSSDNDGLELVENDNVVPWRTNVLPTGSESRERNGEHFILRQNEKNDRVFTLLYQPKVIQAYAMTQLAGGLQVAGTGPNAQFVREPRPEMKKNRETIAQGFVKTIRSFNMFLRRHLRSPSERPILCRVKWLGRLCKVDGVFPSGENSGFLRSVLHSIVNGDKVTIFSEPDLRVSRDLLIDQNAKGRGNHVNDQEHSIVLTENDDGRTVYSVVCGKYDEQKSIVRVSKYEHNQALPSPGSNYHMCDLG